MDLAGKSALVTGASSGIGAAIAKALAAAGVRVSLVARREDRLNEVAEAIRTAGGQALPCVADVRDESALISAFDRTVGEWGGLDILINNAGLGRSADYLTGKTEDWREMLDVNVLALVVASREALARFGPDGGHIVNVASMSAHRVPQRSGLYSATKFAVRSITEGLRLELAQVGNPTRVCEISPGFVATEFPESFEPEDRDRIKQSIANLRALQPEDIAASVLHMLNAPPHVAISDILMRSSDQLT
ncbi:MAG: SDR family NAD(P)-dependent oxidoreductase [Planctomycetota bacterium]